MMGELRFNIWALGMAINTKRVKGRVSLHFDTLDEMLAYAERLVQSGTKQLGNWSLGQNLEHLALIQIASIDGYPPGVQFPWPVRFLLKHLFKKWLLRRGFPPSGPNVKTLTPEPIDAAVALEHLRTATARVQSEGKRVANPGFDEMTLEEWNQLYLRHAELHLGFCVPLKTASAAD